MVQLTELTANTKSGARGLVLPPKLQPGSIHDNTLLDGGFGSNAAADAMAGVGAQVFIVGRSKNAGSGVPGDAWPATVWAPKVESRSSSANMGHAARG